MVAGPPEERNIAMRAYASNAPSADETGTKRTFKKYGGADPGPSSYSLTFDCETTTTAEQQLRVGAYQWRKAGRLLEAGLFYDPLSLTARELAILQRYASHNSMRVRTAQEFVDKVLYGLAYELGALILGFNLPFDISRLAIAHWPCRDREKNSMRGGFSFRLIADDNRPTVQIKHLGSHASLIRFSIPRGQDASRSMRRRGCRPAPRRGYFTDVHSLGAAIAGCKGGLAALAKHLGTLHQKSEAEHGTRLTMKYLDYLANDVQVTWECFDILAKRFQGYGLTRTAINQIYSEASIGKACLKEMGIRPWRELQPDVPPELLGIIMSTYYGGRSEVHIRREITPVLYCDFTSMYPTVSVLMGLWHLVTAKGVRWEDATEETISFLRSFSLTDLAQPGTWQKLAVLVQVLPEMDIFPVRACYDEGSPSYTTGLNYLTGGTPLWFTLADVLVSVLLTGKVPQVLRAMRFRAKERQDDLLPIDILGNSSYRLDPTQDDLYLRLVELRSSIKLTARSTQNEQKKARLEAEQLAVKIMANAACYGIFVELNVTEKAKKKRLTYYGVKGEAQTTEEPLASIEEPGRFFHPLLATLTTGAARLMLGVAEVLAEQEGLTWAFCDTDSMSLACPADLPEGEFRERGERVRRWFEQLNPYRSGDQLFKLERDNLSLEDPTQLAPLYCLAVSAKRYVLVNMTADGKPIIRKGSAHGLGHLRSPYEERGAPASIPAPAASLEDMGLARWQYDLWYRIVEATLENHPAQVRLDDLASLEKKAVSRYAATTPRLLEWFETFNEGRPYRMQVRPFGFLNAFIARSPSRRDPFSLELKPPKTRKGSMTVDQPRAVAPFDRDPAVAIEHAFDRETGEFVSPGFLRSYRQAVAQYHLHREAKFLGGDYLQSGILARRHIRAGKVEHIGKEANHWEERVALGEDPQLQIHYGILGQNDEDKRARLREQCNTYGRRELARKARVEHKTVSRFISGRPVTEETVQKLRRTIELLGSSDREETGTNT